MEDLSNELFYEIFAYLDSCRLNDVFSNLNTRFEQLLNSSNLLLRINSQYLTNDCLKQYEQIIHHHRHQIYSIHSGFSHFSYDFELSFPIDSSLQRLESLALSPKEFRTFQPILHQFACLPRLFSLTIRMDIDAPDIAKIYQIVFTFPVLRYFKCHVTNLTALISLPLATEKQFSSIEDLVIVHDCSLEHLTSLVSYTPRLRRLSYRHINANLPTTRMILPMNLTNLTHLSLHSFDMKFKQFQLLIDKINFQLRTLILTTFSNDIDYLNAYQWEQLISKHFLHLQTLHFLYDGDLDHVIQSFEYLQPTNQFTSSFWTERRWMFQVDILSNNINFSIHPHRYSQKSANQIFVVFLLFRKQWYNIENEVCLSGRLILDGSEDEKTDDDVIVDIDCISSFGQISHLEMTDETVSLRRFTRITHSLPQLKTLKMCYFPECRRDDADQQITLYRTSSTSQINKIYMQELTQLDDFYMLLYVYPSIEYLQIESAHGLDMKLFLQIISKTIIPSDDYRLCSLCLHASSSHDEDKDEVMIDGLAQIINSEKSILNYTVERIADKIYLKWKINKEEDFLMNFSS